MKKQSIRDRMGGRGDAGKCVLALGKGVTQNITRMGASGSYQTFASHLTNAAEKDLAKQPDVYLQGYS